MPRTYISVAERAAREAKRAETNAINNRLIILENLKSKQQQTLCWQCEHAGKDCPRMCMGTQIPGIDAQPTVTADGEKSVMVYDCPMFQFDSKRWQEYSTLFPIIQYWCTIKPNSTNPVSLRTYQRDPQKWIDLYNKEHPECKIIGGTEEDYCYDGEMESSLED